MKTRSKQNWLLTAWCSVLLLFGCTLAGLAQQNQGFVPIGFLQPAGSGTSNPVTAAQGGTGSAANTGATGKILRGNGSGAYVDTPYTVPSTAGGANTILVWDGTNLQTSGVSFPNLAAPPSTGKVLVGNGINYTLSTPTLPITTSPSSGKVMIGNGTNWVASTPAYPTNAGSSGNIITSDGTDFTSSAPSFNASAITAGTLALARGGMGGNMATGINTGTFPISDGVSYASSVLRLPNAASSGQIMIGSGSNIINMSTATYPNTVSGAGKIIRASGADAFSTSTATYPDTAGTSGNVLTSDGTNFVSSAPATGGGLTPTSPKLRSMLRGWSIPLSSSTTFTGNGGVSAFALSSSSTVSAVVDSTGHYISSQSIASNGSEGGFEHGSPSSGVSNNEQPIYWFHIKTGSSISVVRIFVGVTSVIATQQGGDDPATSGMCFRYATSTDGTAFWRTWTNDGSGGGTATTTGQSIATSTDYHLCIDARDSASINFYINGTLVATHTTNLPAASTNMGQIATVTTLENVAKTLLVGPVLEETL